MPTYDLSACRQTTYGLLTLNLSLVGQCVDEWQELIMILMRRLMLGVMLACSVLSSMAAENEPMIISEKYFECLLMWGEEYIGTRATPSQIADVAQSKCEAQMAGYEGAFRDYLLSTSPAGDVGLAAQQAKESAQYVRRLSREKLLEVIIGVRMDTN